MSALYLAIHEYQKFLKAPPVNSVRCCHKKKIDCSAEFWFRAYAYKATFSDTETFKKYIMLKETLTGKFKISLLT